MSTSKSTTTILLATAGAFFTGLAVGLLISPRSGRENRKWLKEQAGEITDWVDEHSRDALHATEDKIQHFASDVKKRIKNNIPDLYADTEHIHMNESELIERENE